MPVSAQKYQRCLVMAGGGFRFSYYLGIYAALSEAGQTPDIVLASCGGAIAAAIIQNLPDDVQRKAWVMSPQMYAFWCGMKSSPQASLLRTVGAVCQRRLFSGAITRVPDLHSDYLFEIPEGMPLPPALAYETRPEVAIIAGKLLYAKGEVGKKRTHDNLFAETVFCDVPVARLIEGMASPVSAPDLPGSLVAPLIETNTRMALADAVRASVSDMFYFRCHSHAETDYIGGVVDLFPIEIAHRLADEVIMEVKSPYDRLISLPAVRAVLGFDGNQRLRHVMQQQADMWIDTSAMEKNLPEIQVMQQVQWRRNRIELVASESYAHYRDLIAAQWEFGYRCALAGIATQKD